MKVALILTGNVWFAPYAKTYTQILDANNIDYDFISFCRDGKKEQVKGFQYFDDINKTNRLLKLVPYFKYARFVKETIVMEKYDRLIFFGPQVPLFIPLFLQKKYKGKYIMDYRDLSIEQKPILKNIYKRILKFSYANVISSPGFKKCLPQGIKYYLSHNFDVDQVKNTLEFSDKNVCFDANNINILTIGGIRDFSSNVEVIEALANRANVHINFVGKGPSAASLEQYVQDNGINNVSFTGYYEKEDEPKYIEECSFMNIFYPKVITHSTAMSNRFYNSLIYKKPMIVTANSTQGDFVEEYNLGLSIDNCEDLYSKLLDWYSSIDFKEYSSKCNELLRKFLEDYNELYNLVESFLR